LQDFFSISKNDWGKAFSCYYSGNFVTGYKHGYVQKVTQAFLAAADKKSAAVSLVAPVIKPTENKLEGSVVNISDMPATVANTDTNKRISKTTTQVVNKTYNKLETQGQPSEFTDVAQVF
jgi:type IV secretion system protein VirB1